MLYKFTTLYGKAVKATDGLIGTVWDILFNERTGDLRHVVVNISNRPGRRVLIAPEKCTFYGKLCSVEMSRKEIRRSPDRSVDSPVYLPDRERVGFAFFISSSLNGRSGCLPMHSSTLPDNKEISVEGGPQLRSVKEVGSYFVKDRLSGRSCGQSIDVIVNDSPWRFVCFIVKSCDPRHSCFCVSIDRVDSMDYRDSSINLKKGVETFSEAFVPG